MGRQEREWAEWTDEERDRLLGGTSAPAPPRWRGVRSRRNELTLLAMLVTVAASLGCWQLHLFSFPVSAPHRAAAPTAAVVYGTGRAHNGSTDMTCTAMVSDASGGESCTVWTILLPGPAGRPGAAPPGRQNVSRSDRRSAHRSLGVHERGHDVEGGSRSRAGSGH